MQNTITISGEASIEPLAPAHLPYILQLLPQVLDPNPLVRNPASNELINLESRPNYCSILLVRNNFYFKLNFHQMGLLFFQILKNPKNIGIINPSLFWVSFYNF
jgi:hypothetical protein